MQINSINQNNNNASFKANFRVMGDPFGFEQIIKAGAKIAKEAPGTECDTVIFQGRNNILTHDQHVKLSYFNGDEPFMVDGADSHLIRYDDVWVDGDCQRITPEEHENYIISMVKSLLDRNSKKS